MQQWVVFFHQLQKSLLGVNHTIPGNKVYVTQL